MDISARLARELQQTTDRLRHEAQGAFTGGGTGAFGDPRALVDAVDDAQRSLEQEMFLAARSRLRERAQRLVGALERLREGSYGICEECEAPIAPARLAALPEVTTCLPCQRRREASAAHVAEPEVMFADIAD